MSNHTQYWHLDVSQTLKLNMLTTQFLISLKSTLLYLPHITKWYLCASSSLIQKPGNDSRVLLFILCIYSVNSISLRIYHVPGNEISSIKTMK